MPRRGSEAGAADKRIQAVRLRAQGLTYRAIGRRLGVSYQYAHRLVMAGLKVAAKRFEKEAAALAELEWERMEADDATLSKLLRGSQRLKPLEQVAVVDAKRKLSESRRKLRGLDAPKKMELTGKDGGPIVQVVHGIDEEAFEPAPPES